eukprot:SAG31_NODE_3120_length_4655_cov_1.886304_2_plen_234_part_00
MNFFQDGVQVLQDAMQKDAMFQRGKQSIGQEVAELYRAGRDLFQQAIDSSATEPDVKAALIPKIAGINKRLTDLAIVLPVGTRNFNPSANSRFDGHVSKYGTSGRLKLELRDPRRRALSVQANAATQIQAKFRGYKSRQLSYHLHNKQRSASVDHDQAGERGSDEIHSETALLEGAGGDVPAELSARQYLARYVYPALQPALQALDFHRPNAEKANQFLCDCLISQEFLQVCS